MQTWFWLSLFIIFYAYIGYGILLFIILKIKRIIKPDPHKPNSDFKPAITLVIPTYNEVDTIMEKVSNSLELLYDKTKLTIIFITDGSTDGTYEKLKSIDGITVLHEPTRKGKSAAENRSMKFVKTPIVAFCDANTYLPPETLLELVKHYADEKVGAVAGEKRIMVAENDTASGSGEGFYWKYESTLKKMDSELLTVVGAAGELFSFRTKLFIELEEDTILDDFMLSLRIAEQGYRVLYEPEAYALETASESVGEELKRKIRIGAGGWQSMVRLASLLNFFKHPVLTFQYVSHRVLRWSIAPLCLLILIPLNFYLHLQFSGLYTMLMAGQFVFYLLAITGWYFANRKIKVKILFIPYYFFIMNYAVILGFFRYLKGSQSAAWERSKRAQINLN